MNTIAIIYFLIISIFSSAELRRYSARVPQTLYGQNMSIVQDDKVVRSALKDINLLLFTRKNAENQKSFKPSQAAKLKESNVFDPKKANFFIIHGWAASYKSDQCVWIKNAILKQTDMNVFVVDWKGPAGWTYRSARDVVSKVGDLIAEFINDMVKIFLVPASSFKIAGHSLGAHIAGCIGKKVNAQIDYIIGMDPARPLFKLNHLDILNISDASFVQVIHTCADLYGFDSSMGHVDIYPNNGFKQPGCEMDLTNACSHGRSYELYSESLLSGGFTTKQCDTYKEYKKGNCNKNPSSYLGGVKVDKTASGDHYLDTNSKSPFSKN